MTLPPMPPWYRPFARRRWRKQVQWLWWSAVLRAAVRAAQQAIAKSHQRVTVHLDPVEWN